MTNNYQTILRNLKAKHGLTAQDMTVVARYVTGDDKASALYLTNAKASMVANELTANDKHTIHQRIAQYRKDHA